MGSARYFRAGVRRLLSTCMAAGAVAVTSVLGTSGIITVEATVADPGLALPWTSGQSWGMYGPHAWDDVTSHRWNSLDLSGGDGHVLAARGGTVHLDGCSKTTGGYVRVDHGSGWNTTYYHLTSIAVNEGQTVSKGTPLGYTGTVTSCKGGGAAGAHVHFSLWKVGQSGCSSFSTSNASCAVAWTNYLGHPVQIGNMIVSTWGTQYAGCLTSMAGTQVCTDKAGNVRSGVIKSDGSVAANLPNGIPCPGSPATLTSKTFLVISGSLSTHVTISLDRSAIGGTRCYQTRVTTDVGVNFTLTNTNVSRECNGSSTRQTWSFGSISADSSYTVSSGIWAACSASTHVDDLGVALGLQITVYGQTFNSSTSPSTVVSATG